MRVRVKCAVAAAGLFLVVPACVPDAAPAPTRLAITTQLTWCGGVIPPPGEPWCRTNPSSREVEVRLGREVVATGATDAAGRLTLDVVAGRYVVAAIDPPTYMECDQPVVTVAAGVTTEVVQTCTVFAP